jgi:biopolymer transport protein ExbB
VIPTQTIRNFVLVAAIFLVATSSAWAQATPEIPHAENIKYFDFFVVKGGWIAYIIMALSVVALALVIEHSVSIRRSTIVPPLAIEQMMSLMGEREYEQALQYSADEPSMLGYVVNTALLEAPNGFGAMERALEEALEERSAKLYRKTEYLNIIGAVSPMLGLFGTVVGMILLFSAIHAADSFPRAQVVADNVAVALVATFWGLAVAIPSLSIYAMFRNRIEVLTAECALAADRIIGYLKPATAAAPIPITPALASPA